MIIAPWILRAIAPEENSGCRWYAHCSFCIPKRANKIKNSETRCRTLCFLLLRVMCSGLLPDNVDGGFTAWILQLLRFVLIFVITSLLALFGKWTFSSCVCCRVQHIEVKKKQSFWGSWCRDQFRHVLRQDLVMTVTVRGIIFNPYVRTTVPISFVALWIK